MIFTTAEECSEYIAKNFPNKKLVFTNGCFDLIHTGHLRYLNDAKELGDLLVVGLNSDSSVRTLKGSKRPIIPEMDRAELLNNLKSVDMVVLFSEETPKNLIETISPQVLVKGGDYDLKTIVGAEHVLALGGEVKALQFVEGFSTSQIIDKISQLYS